jgi:phosphoglucomutase
MSILERVRAGFDSLEVDEAFRAMAMENLGRWLEEPELAAYRPQIEAAIEAGRWDFLLDCFYQVIPFGTGGRRGPVGVGPNRINPWTIETSIQGHSDWLRRRRGTDDLTVVIAYDVRRFKDARGQYDPGRPNPVLGLSSRDFAEQAAGIYAANGVKVWILPRSSDTYVSTPELSFAIRYLDADGGLNVSASHNPADDNGAKIYNHLGGQEIPPHDEDLARAVAAVTEVKRLSYEEGVERGLILPLTAEVHDAYIDTNVRRSLRSRARSAKVVFTGLHGTGTTTVVEVLRKAGFEVEVEPTQAPFDGDFPSVPFGIPNPEVAQSMDAAVAFADARDADLVMACDPDADRLGLVVRHEGGWRFINGNEMAALVVDYGLRARTWPRPPVVIKTEVTSSLVSRIARAGDAKVVGHLLVGFKYIGEGLRLLEEVGSFYNVEARVQEFLVGVEESHGLLVTHEIRDKDAAGGALWLAEAASLEKERGRTLVDRLEDCWREVGYVRNELISTVMRGATGRSRIKAIQASIRENPPSLINGMKVTAFHDRANPRGPFGRVRSGTDAASRDVLVLEMGDRARLILRPSGTEPKNKVYAEFCGEPGEPLEQAIPRVEAACRELAEAFVSEMLGRVGIHLPRWAIRVSDLVAVEQKQHFAEVLMPGLVERLAADQPAEDWLAEQLSAYGRDGRALVRPGVAAWIAQTGPSEAVAAAVRSLFEL